MVDQMLSGAFQGLVNRTGKLVCLFTLFSYQCFLDSWWGKLNPMAILEGKAVPRRPTQVKLAVAHTDPAFLPTEMSLELGWPYRRVSVVQACHVSEPTSWV